MFERFTDLARRVVVLAQEEARLLNHNYIGTEHLLLGLLHDEAQGLARQALTELGVSAGAVREQIRVIVGAGERGPSGHIPFTPRAKKVLELALREAMQLGTDYIGTEHLLLGLLREGQGVAAQVLSKLGKSLDEVRHTVIALYEQQPPEAREPQQAGDAGDRARERDEASGADSRFSMPGLLRRGIARAYSPRTGREFAENAPAAPPRPPVRAGDPVVRRTAEWEALLSVLARREHNNALLVGPSGCGKSALVRDLAQTLAANRGPASVGSAEVVELDLAALRAGVERVVRRSASPVVLVEDLDLLLRADDLSGGRIVTALAGLAESESPLIVTASAEARDRFEQGFPTLATRLHAVELAEASGAHAREVLEQLRPALQRFHGIVIDDSALTAAIELAPRVLGGRVLPGGAVDLLDTAAARLVVRAQSPGGTPALTEAHLREAA
jgi:ATP-dependent Clp protease ATP-binding subunit ClpC